MDLGLTTFISKFANNTKIGNAVFSESDRKSLQEYLRKLSDWSIKWEMTFNIDKCLILQVRSRNIKNDYEMRGVKIKTVYSVNDRGVTVASNLKFSQQCNESLNKANRMMGLIKINFSFKNKNHSLIVLSDLIWSMPSSFSPPTKQNIAKLECAQRRAAKLNP